MKKLPKYKIIPDLDSKHTHIWRVKKLCKFMFLSFYKEIAYFYTKNEAIDAVKHLQSEIIIKEK